MKYYKKLFFLINILISLLCCIIFSTFAVLPITIFYVGIVYLLIKNNDKIYLHFTIVSIILSLSVLLLYFGYLKLYNFPYYNGGSDDYMFEYCAKYLLDNNLNKYSQVVEESSKYSSILYPYWNCLGYIYFISKIIKYSSFIGGYSTILPRFFNIYLIVIISIFIYKIILKERKKVCPIIIYLMCLFPNILFISSHIFRDVFVVFFAVVIVYLCHNCILQNKIYIRYIPVFIVILLVSYEFRQQSIILELAILLYAFLEIVFKKTYWKILALIPLLIFAFIYFNVDDIFNKYFSFYQNYIVEESSGLSSFIFSLDLFPVGFIFRCLYGLIYPIPIIILDIFKTINIVTIFNVLIGVGTIIQIYLLPYLFKKFKSLNFMNFCFIVSFLMVVFTTFTFRHFLFVYPFMFYIVYNGFFESDILFKKKSFLVVSLAIFLATTSYLLFKLF